MLLSTTTFLSLLAVIPFALASPTRVQERDPTRVQEREKPDPAIYTDEPSMQFFADTKDRCSSSDFVKIDLENPGCQAFNGKGMYSYPSINSTHALV